MSLSPLSLFSLLLLSGKVEPYSCEVGFLTIIQTIFSNSETL